MRFVFHSGTSKGSKNVLINVHIRAIFVDKNCRLKLIFDFKMDIANAERGFQISITTPS